MFAAASEVIRLGQSTASSDKSITSNPPSGILALQCVTNSWSESYPYVGLPTLLAAMLKDPLPQPRSTCVSLGDSSADSRNRCATCGGVGTKGERDAVLARYSSKVLSGVVLLVVGGGGVVARQRVAVRRRRGGHTGESRLARSMMASGMQVAFVTMCASIAESPQFSPPRARHERVAVPGPCATPPRVTVVYRPKSPKRQRHARPPERWITPVRNVFIMFTPALVTYLYETTTSPAWPPLSYPLPSPTRTPFMCSCLGCGSNFCPSSTSKLISLR